MGLSVEKDVSGWWKIDFRAMGIALGPFLKDNGYRFGFKKLGFLELRAVLCYFLEKKSLKVFPCFNFGRDALRA